MASARDADDKTRSKRPAGRRSARTSTTTIANGMATSPMNAHTRMLARNGERQSSAYGSSASKIATRATASARANPFGMDMRRTGHDSRGSFRSDGQHNLANMRTRLHARVRIGGLTQRKGRVHHRPYPPRRQQRQRVLLDRARDCAL